MIGVIILLVVIIGYVYYYFDRKMASKELEIKRLKEKNNCVDQEVITYNKEVEITEELITTHIDDWDEVRIYHPLFNQTYLYAIMDIFKKLEFVERVYIAANGLLRINIKGKSKNYGDDIGVHSSTSGELSIIRNYEEGFKEMEDMVIKEIIDHTESIVKTIENMRC